MIFCSESSSLYQGSTVVKFIRGSYIFINLSVLYYQDHNDNFRNAFDGTTSSPGDIALAFYQVLWAYNGWWVDRYNMYSYALWPCRSTLVNTVEENKNAAKYI